MTGQINVNKIAARTGTAITVESGHVITQPGSVIQVLQETRATYFETSSDSFVDTGFAITITPKLATSKILLQVNVFCTIQNGGQGSINIHGSAEGGLLSSDTYGFGGLYDAGLYQMSIVFNWRTSASSELFMNLQGSTDNFTSTIYSHGASSSNGYIIAQEFHDHGTEWLTTTWSGLINLNANEKIRLKQSTSLTLTVPTDDSNGGQWSGFYIG